MNADSAHPLARLRVREMKVEKRDPNRSRDHARADLRGFITFGGPQRALEQYPRSRLCMS